jgi:hypothetical protein
MIRTLIKVVKGVVAFIAPVLVAFSLLIFVTNTAKADTVGVHQAARCAFFAHVGQINKVEQAYYEEQAGLVSGKVLTPEQSEAVVSARNELIILLNTSYPAGVRDIEVIRSGAYLYYQNCKGVDI